MILFLFLLLLVLSVGIFGAVKLHLVLSEFGPQKTAAIVCLGFVSFKNPRLNNSKLAHDLAYKIIRAYIKFRGWPL